MTGLVSVGSPKASRVASIATICAKKGSNILKMIRTLKIL
jgi:hypothetical protein